MEMLYIGTSGYSYKDWIGNFYPKSIKPQDMLEFYARQFNFIEINYTYYRIPTAKMFNNMQKKTDEDFIFSVKLHQSMTHERAATNQDYAVFKDAVSVLYKTGKLGCLVAQFPYSFYNTKENVDYIKALREHFKDYQVAIEFRNNRWIDEQTFQMLKDNDLSYVCVDEPQISGLIDKIAVAGSKTSYVRFHGRNNEKWWKQERAYERYDYLYKKEELEEWKEKIKLLEQQSENCYISFNNHFNAQAVMNGRMLKEVLGVNTSNDIKTLFNV